LAISTGVKRILPRVSARSSGRSSSAVLLSGTVLLVLLLASFLPLAAASGSHSTASALSPAVSHGASNPNAGGQKHNWDWKSLADSDGYVDVMVSWSEQAKKSNSHSAKDNDLMDKFSHGMKERYSKAFDGFMSHVSLDVIDQYLQSGDDSIQVYPDMQVNATISDDMVDIGADQVWSRADTTGSQVTGQGVVVAIIDTGVDYTHPDLGGGIGPGYKVIGGYDFYNHDSDPMDDNGHGTHVAGIIAADGQMKGVAPGASILAYKALGADGCGSVSDIILAIDRAMDPNQDGDTSDHAQIISMSLGGKGQSDDPACQAVENAISCGIVVVVAAGNDGPSIGTVASPGLAPDAITVGAVDGDGVLADFSSRGTSPSLSIKPEISAPGVLINSTVPYSNAVRASSTGYAVMSGTSMATPHVAGGAALLLQMHTDWTPQQVKSALVSGASKINESVWSAGAGEMWLPGSIDANMFFNPAIVSYGLAGASPASVSVSMSGTGASVSLNPIDYYDLTADGEKQSAYWTNLSGVNPTQVWVPHEACVSLTLNVPVPPVQAPEGYYDGDVSVTGGGSSTHFPFGFAVLSRVNIHVIDMSGREVFDPYAGVWVYENPGAQVAVGIRGSLDKPAPPASFLLPSGSYSAHSFGHQLLYEFSDPYVLASEFTLGRLETKDIYVNMSSAHAFTLNLQTDEGLPIYVKDYRVYGRYEGANNISFHLVGSDYSVDGSEIFSLPKSKTIYISDTDIRIGVAVSGFSYTSAMWDFMSRNWQHWYEYSNSCSTTFYQEASADLQYLMAWEFDGVDSSTNTALTLVPGMYSVYDTKYDIPGSIQDIWGDWGKHRSMGGDSAFYIRRDTDTSLNAFFSGMTRRTIVQGVFTETYFPGDLFEGYFEKQYYSPDYSALVRANLAAEVYLPDRNFLTAIDGVVSSDRTGAGPFYPSIRTENTASSMVIYQPLLRDQSGAKIGGMSMPSMTLYVGGNLAGVYQIAEYLARPDAKRIIPLSQAGTFTAKIHYTPVPQICQSVDIELGFKVPSGDMDPPQIMGLDMAQRFVPGDRVPIIVNAIDAVSVSTVTMSWRAASTDPWTPLAVSSGGGSSYGASIQTTASTASIDLMIRVTDSSGNYILYTASSVAEAQIPVVFNLSASQVDIGYRNGDASVVLTGTLSDALGNPLHPTAGVPIELWLGDRKVAMILDEYVVNGSHSHNGTIRFEWHFNPAIIFTGPDQTVNIDAVFDLGIYQPVHRTITLHSVPYYNLPPRIELNSPYNNSLIPAGRVIDFDIIDDGTVQAQMRLDGNAPVQLKAPWDVNTTSWSAGVHVIEITATDDQLVSNSSVFSFNIDNTYPRITLNITAPGTAVPLNWTLTANVYDDHLDQVTCAVDGGAPQLLPSPYSVSTVGWALGNHTVTIEAVDLVEHRSSNTTNFEIRLTSVVTTAISPKNGDVVRSGTPILFSVLCNGAFTNRWAEYGAWHSLGSGCMISTAGWSEGSHTITINSTDSLGGWCELSLTFIIDDTRPVIELNSPANQSFVDHDARLNVSITDANFKSVSWTLWNQTRTSTSANISISLNGSSSDGTYYVLVSAVDKAGNVANATFVFLLDSSAPKISWVGVGDGEAVLPDQVIRLEITDAFLANVSIAFDAGPATPLLPPYTFDCKNMSFGYRGIHVWAYDHSGKYSQSSITPYVDGTPPVVVTDFPATASSDVPLNLNASITDDFAVKDAELFFQLSSGSFLSVFLQGSGSNFTGTIPARYLWDGMSVYVMASDFVGHVTKSDQVVLHVTGASEQTPVPPGNDGPGLHFSRSSLVSMLSLGVASSLILLYYVFPGGRRKRRDEKEPSVLRHHVSALDIKSARETTYAFGESTVKEAPSRGRVSVTQSIASPGVTYQAKPASKEPEAVRESVKQPSLIDSIPAVKLGAPDKKMGDQEDDTDYGDLILKELVFPNLKNSVFQKESDDLFDRVGRSLEELEQTLSGERKRMIHR
jgi:subtilisin family serine protease